jgi:beta-lactamase class D
MEYSAEVSPLVAPAQRTDLAIRGYKLYGHTSSAISGNNQQVSWFLGFIRLPDNSAVVIVVVIENATSPDSAARIAGDTFQAIALASD